MAQVALCRGTREVYRGKDLEKIGMPVGGLCAGQLYLGGDGKLWHWDIFNKAMGTGDHNYAHPPLPASPLEQGFAVEIVADGKKNVRASGPFRVLRRHFLRRVPDCIHRVPRSTIARRRIARGILAVRSSGHAGIQPAGDRDALHGQEHQRGEG